MLWNTNGFLRKVVIQQREQGLVLEVQGPTPAASWRGDSESHRPSLLCFVHAPDEHSKICSVYLNCNVKFKMENKTSHSSLCYLLAMGSFHFLNPCSLIHKMELPTLQITPLTAK